MIKTMKLRDANVYVNSTSTHGQSTEITLPEIIPSKNEYKALGMVGVRKFFTGFDAMECSIKWNSPENEVAIACSNPLEVVNLMIRSSRDVYEGGNLVRQEPVVFFVKGTPANIPLGTLKPKEDTETETKLDLTYIKWVQNGVEILELDIDNNIFVVGGEDLLATYRENLGL